MASSKNKEIIDNKGGLRFGADADDGSDSEYVSALPTDEEERRMEQDAKAREELEDLDEGRASSHPSTLAATNNKVAREVRTVQHGVAGMEWICACFIRRCSDCVSLFVHTLFLNDPTMQTTDRRRSIQARRRGIWVGEHAHRGS